MKFIDVTRRSHDIEVSRFYRLPQQFFYMPVLEALSGDAKILYSLLLDRLSLSVKNFWYDDAGYAYVYFTLDDIQSYIHCSRNKALRLLDELDSVTGVGLIRRHRQGQGRPDRIYVRLIPERISYEELEEWKAKKRTSGSSKKELPAVTKPSLRELDI